MAAPSPGGSDLNANPPLDGVIRVETHSRADNTYRVVDMIRSVYPHNQIYGDFCTVQGYADVPPRELYEWLSRTQSLDEWTYSTRGLEETDEPDLWVGHDKLNPDTKLFVRTIANADAMTVDYHCAWDQGTDLWMIYLMRVVDAQVVLGKPGSVVLWTNCHHPYYDDNPYPDTAPADREEWVGDLWDVFWAGHQIELDNLIRIAEYRHRNDLPLTPDWMRQ
ncbi:SRPBCC family protein [Gordonia sp. CPCC 205333]|uniref:SRPBCC family protein n=1 Tax=Gordonia sp. CPCC 205333 TaxID=3140790 RepID=UPI003AF37F23